MPDSRDEYLDQEFVEFRNHEGSIRARSPVI